MALPAFETLVDEPAAPLPAFDALVDDTPAFDDLVDEPAAPAPPLTPEQLQQTQQAGMATLDMLTLPARFDWSQVAEEKDKERFAQYVALRKQADELEASDPNQSLDPRSQSNALRRQAFGIQQQMSPGTEAGRGAASIEQGALQSSAEAMQREQTPKETFRIPNPFARGLGGFLGPALSSQAMPVIEEAGRNLGGAGGGALGASMMLMPGGGLLRFLLPLGGGFVGSQLGAQAQENVQQATETPQDTAIRHQQIAEAREQFPVSTDIGRIASNAPFFGFSLREIGRALAGDRAARQNIGIAGAIGAGMVKGSEFFTGQKVTLGEMAKAAAENILMNRPTSLGRALGFHGEVPVPKIEQPQFKDAQQISQASPPDGGVRPSQIAPQDVPLPAAQGSEGVQPGRPGEPLAQAAPAEAREVIPPLQEIIPAITVEGQEVVGRPGDEHLNIFDRHFEGRSEDEKILAKADFDAPKRNPNYFVDAAGNKISREQLKQWYGVSSSQELRALQIAEAKKTAAAAVKKPRTDEERIAELVERGMSEEEARAGVARAKAEDVPPAPTGEVFYRGTVPGETLRIKEPFEAAKGKTFVARNRSSAEQYGSSIEEIRAKPGAKILKSESPEFWKLIGRRKPANGYIGSAGRKGEKLTDIVNDAIRRAEAAGYDAISFSSDADIGTILLNEDAFTRAPISPETQTGTTPTPPSTGEPAARGGVEPPVVPPEPPVAGRAPEAPLEPGATSNKEAVVNAERAARKLDPVVKEVAIENPAVVEHAENAIEADPDLPQRIVDRLREAPPQERVISLSDAGILLIERTKLRARRDAALARVSRKEGSTMAQAIAREEFNIIEGQLNAMDQAAQDARSTWGRFGQFWQRSMREDFSLANLERRARLSKDEPLTPKELDGIKAIANKAKAAQEAFDIRQKQLDLENRQNAIESKIAEVSEKAKGVDPAVKSIADRIIARMDIAAKSAEKSLRSRLLKLGSTPDPLIVLDVAKIAAAQTVKKSIQFAQFSAEMIKKFGEKIRPFLQAGWDQREQHIDASIAAGAGAKKKEVAERIKPAKAPLNAAAQQERIENAIGNRIKEGKPISTLAPYVNKLQESFIAQGINEREALIDAVHSSLKKHDPAITRDDAMEVMSKYGSDYATPLSKDPVKQTRRQVDGEIQQLLKLRDIAAKVPLPKSGPERPAPGPVWRNLIKQVNAAKRKLGVVVTDPESQLKSSQDAIRTRLRNEIEDMTLELETGERPADKTPAEYTQDMEILRGIRDRVRETLREIEGNPKLSNEQRLALTKRSAEESLAMWERRLRGEEAKAPGQRLTSPEIEAIRARRDAVKAEVEELNAHDAVLQENKKAEALVRQIEATEALIADNAVKAKVQGADSELVAEAREQLAALRVALDLQRANDPQRQLEAIEKAETTLEASIKKLDEQIQAGDISTKKKPDPLESDRLTYLRAQRDAMNKLRNQMRADARPRLSADQLAIKMRTTQMLKRAADLRKRIAKGDFGPRTRKPPVDISGDKAALDAQADLMNVDAEFQKLQEQWKLDQMNFVQKRWRNLGQAWDATANMFLSFDLSTPLQTAFAMAAHPIEGAKAIGKGARVFADQFFRFSDDYARREAARIASSPNSKNGVYKAMKLELPTLFGKKREENMASVLEQLADLDARWAGLPDVVKGLIGMEGKSLIRGGKRLASVIPKVAGSGIKASNLAFETIANTMRARTADALLARWYGKGRGTPTKQQLELLGEHINIFTGKGGLQSGDSVRRLLFAPNYYLSIIKQLSGYQLLKSGLYHYEGKVAESIATEYVRAIASMGTLYGLAWLFGDREKMTFDWRSKDFGQAQTDKGTGIDITMGRGKWITALGQILTGERVDERGRVKDVNRKGTALAFAGGRLSRGVSSALTSAFGEDYRGKPITGIEIAKDFVIPLGWRNFDELLKKEGLTRGSFIQLLNLLGVTHNIHE